VLGRAFAPNLSSSVFSHAGGERRSSKLCDWSRELDLWVRTHRWVYRALRMCGQNGRPARNFLPHFYHAPWPLDYQGGPYHTLPYQLATVMRYCTNRWTKPLGSTIVITMVAPHPQAPPVYTKTVRYILNATIRYLISDSKYKNKRASPLFKRGPWPRITHFSRLATPSSEFLSRGAPTGK
jgi:hypothetical protein